VPSQWLPEACAVKSRILENAAVVSGGHTWNIGPFCRAFTRLASMVPRPAPRRVAIIAERVLSSYDAVVGTSTSERPPPTIGKYEGAGWIVVLDQGRAASYRDGRWQPGVAFQSRTILEFDQVLDPDERARILAEAEPYLDAFAREWDVRTVVPVALNCDTAQAQQIMGTAGLASKIVLVASYRRFPAGVVVGQSPAAGTVVPRGSIVTFVVASEDSER
jgi:hypothetical protein